MDNSQHVAQISGVKLGKRLDSRILEEEIQKTVAQGFQYLNVTAHGQHGIGGRLWRAGDKPVHVKVEGHSGQRLGSMGFPNTTIEVFGPVSDDVGWLNAGSHIVVHGNTGNGAANAMAQGKIYVAGNIGARGMTMTKQNPRFEPPELWILGTTGDYFAEFMAGGIAVVCGVDGQNPDNVLGYRPFVGMVGGRCFFRGPHKGFSQTDAKLVPLGDEDFKWLQKNLKLYLDRIKRPELLNTLSDRQGWQLIVARQPHEKHTRKLRDMASFKRDVWDAELGKGGLIGDLTDLDRSAIGLIPSGDMRRYVPVWENRTYKAPCEATCPTGIPVHERWRLVREGRIDEAVDLAMAYTPFPATVCGYLCPNPCMQSCTRQIATMPPVDITKLGQASISAKTPELPVVSGQRIAVIGGGPAGISVAWQLRQMGHEAVVFDQNEKLGGKLISVIPGTRIPQEVLNKELERINEVLAHVHLQQPLTSEDLERIREDYDFVIIAAGAQTPRTLPIPGKEHLQTATAFLQAAKTDEIQPGQRVVIIGAGNVGCDVATEAHRLGARDITLIDVQEPASFGKERELAEAVGAKFKWPCFTEEITTDGVLLKTGEVLPADTVVISIGDQPDLEFLPGDIEVARGFVKVNDHFQTSDARVFAIGDVVGPGLLTDAIGAGRKTAQAIDDLAAGRSPLLDDREMIDRQRITLEYFDPRIQEFSDSNHCSSQCSSCGACRDCGICVTICPKAAIFREDVGSNDYEYRVHEGLCIGCGYCAQACPCGIWNLVENTPIG